MRVVAALLAAILPMCQPVQDKPANRCPQYERLLEVHSPGWDVARMSRIMWRESRCQPDVRSRTRDTGLLQINDVNLEYLRDRGVDVTQLRDPDVNVQAGAMLFRYWFRVAGDGYQPWKGTKGS